METTYYVIGFCILAIVVAVVSQKADFKWGSLMFKTDNRYSKNKAFLKGNKNKINQGTNHVQNTSDNNLDVDGDENELIQG